MQPIDIACMKQLHTRVNIVPVVGKADTLTQKELRELKKKVKAIFIVTFKKKDERVKSRLHAFPWVRTGLKDKSILGSLWFWRIVLLRFTSYKKP